MTKMSKGDGYISASGRAGGYRFQGLGSVMESSTGGAEYAQRNAIASERSFSAMSFGVNSYCKSEK